MKENDRLDRLSKDIENHHYPIFILYRALSFVKFHVLSTKN